MSYASPFNRCAKVAAMAGGYAVQHVELRSGQNLLLVELDDVAQVSWTVSGLYLTMAHAQATCQRELSSLLADALIKVM